MPRSHKNIESQLWASSAGCYGTNGRAEYTISVLNGAFGVEGNEQDPYMEAENWSLVKFFFFFFFGLIEMWTLPKLNEHFFFSF